ncbi:MAG TPA: EamA family transporter [Rhodoglobus sp.]|nr:EamA family transporter [Rhodoglobus sp.]
MLTVVVGLASALVYGFADFFGGLAARRIRPIPATAAGAVAGVVIGMLALALIGGTWSRDAVVLGLLSGAVAAAAVGMLYACLAIGPMSILSPLTAVVSAIVPVVVGLASGEQPGPLGFVALPLCLVAVVLVGFAPDPQAVRPTGRGILLGIGAGAAIGTFLVILDSTPEDSGAVPLLFNRAANAAVMVLLATVLIALARRRAPSGGVPWRQGLPLALAAGTLDTMANAGLLLGVRLGDLSVIAVLTALYPAGTIILARIVLRERITPLQYVGLGLAVAGGALLALA